MTDKKILIAGAGIVGLCSAYYLRKKGFDVTVIDAGDGIQNCSFGNAGFLCPSHVIPLAAPGIITQGIKWMLNEKSPFYVKPKLDSELISWGWKFKQAATQQHVTRSAPVLHQLTTRSQQLAEQMIDDEGLITGYTKSGLLMACRSESALHHEIEAAKAAGAFGQRFEVLSKAEALALNPGLEMDIIGGVYFLDDTLITPHYWTAELRNLLSRSGVAFYDYTRVEKFEVRNGHLEAVVTNNGHFEADEFVVATGSLTYDLLKPLQINIPMQGGKGYSFSAPVKGTAPKVPAIFVDGKVSMSPMLDGLRFSGTMEINGHMPDINPKRLEGIRETVMKFLPQYKPQDFEGAKPWAGFRPCSPDGLPYLGRSARYSNLTIATGHAMLGITLGAVSGDVVSRIIAGEPQQVDLSLLNVDRYNK